MQEEPNPIKDFLFDYIENSNTIQELTAQKKFDKVIDEITQNCYDKIISMGDKDEVASCLRGIAYGYFQMGQYSTAMNRVQESLKISEATGDEEGVSWCINALGVFYSRQGNDHKALESFLKALEMNEKLDDQISIAYSLRNIASHYYALGDKEKTLETSKKT